jgi:hypothetical protein
MNWIRVLVLLFFAFLAAGCLNQPNESTTPEPDQPLGPVQVVWAVHVEGWAREQTNEVKFAKHVKELEKMRSVLESNGIVATWEIRTDEFLAGVINHDSGIIHDWLAAGHAVEIHADLGGTNNNSLVLADQLRNRVQAMQDYGLSPKSVSGICSEADWVSAVADNGLEMVDGVVEYCLKSLTMENLPTGYSHIAGCAGPASCHSSMFYEDLYRSITPWRPLSPHQWPDMGGNSSMPLIIPGGPWNGSLKCLAEGYGNNCSLTYADAVTLQEGLDQVLGGRVVDQFHAFGITESVGSVVLMPGLIAVAEYLALQVDAGNIEFVIPEELIQRYAHWEETGEIPMTNKRSNTE